MPWIGTSTADVNSPRNFSFLLKPLRLVFHLVLRYVSTFAALASRKSAGAFPGPASTGFYGNLAICKIYHRDLLERGALLAFPIPVEFMPEHERSANVVG